MLNPATRFLRAELERIETELYTMEARHGRDASAYYDEYVRRGEIIREIMLLAVTSDAAVAVVKEKIAIAEMLLEEMIEAGRNGVDDQLIANLTIDHDYLIGLLKRLKRGIASETFEYRLANVKRL